MRSRSASNRNRPYRRLVTKEGEIVLRCDLYLTPASLDEALSLLSVHAGNSRLIAGATDLIPYAREARGGDIFFPVLIDLSRVPELSGASRSGPRLRMGANTTFGDFIKEPLLRTHARVLEHCAWWVADDQIRAVATIGGNIVNASPAADGTVALLALNATVHLAGLRDGVRYERSLPLSDFVLGPGLTALGQGEILTAVECDALGSESGTSFQKVGRRRSLVISVASAAGVVTLTPQGDRFADVRLALGAVSPVPIRVRECEEQLIGRPVTAEVIKAAAALGADRVSSRTRQAYRRDVVVTFLERAITDALNELGLRVEVNASV